MLRTPKFAHPEKAGVMWAYQPFATMETPKRLYGTWVGTLILMPGQILRQECNIFPKDKLLGPNTSFDNRLIGW